MQPLAAAARSAGNPASIGWLSLSGRGTPAMVAAAPPADAAAADRAAEAADKVFTNPLASHALTLDPPAAMLAGKEGTLEPLQPLPSPISTSSIGAPSSSGGGSSSGHSGGGDRHLRKLTKSLVEVLETMGSSVQPAPPGGSRSSSRGARQGGAGSCARHGRVVGGLMAARALAGDDCAPVLLCAKCTLCQHPAPRPLPCRRLAAANPGRPARRLSGGLGGGAGRAPRGRACRRRGRRRSGGPRAAADHHGAALGICNVGVLFTVMRLATQAWPAHLLASLHCHGFGCPLLPPTWPPTLMYPLPASPPSTARGHPAPRRHRAAARPAAAGEVLGAQWCLLSVVRHTWCKHNVPAHLPTAATPLPRQASPQLAQNDANLQRAVPSYQPTILAC